MSSEFICDDGLDNDGDGAVDCADPDCAPFSGCSGSVEVDCSNGVDDDGDNNTDCYDTDCATDPVCITPEDCSNSVDDDADGTIDCADSDCLTHFNCGGSETDCINGADDDADGDSDCDDSDCASDPVCSSSFSYSADIYPIFQASGCVGCHSTQFSNLNTLLSVQAGDYNSSSSGANMPWLTPGDPNLSYLYHKVEGTHASVGGSGSQMPKNQPALSSSTILEIGTWIDGGCQP